MNILNKTITKIIFLTLIQINFAKTQSLLINQTTIKNLNSWNKECIQTDITKTFINKDKVSEICKNFFQTMKNKIDKTEWINKPIRFNNVEKEFYKSYKKLNKEKTYEVEHVFKDCIFKHAQKNIIDENSTVLVVGDIHGSYKTLKKILENWANKRYINKNLKFKKDIYAVFLGDYEDRGFQGSEIITTLMQLKTINPEQLILMRGNHEYYYYNEIELMNKYPNRWNSVCRIFNACFEILPDVLYIGYNNPENKNINYMQLNHGGMERKYNPEKLLTNKNNKCLEELPLNLMGFKWNYIIRKNRKEEVNRYVWQNIEMKEQHNTKVIKYIKNNLQKENVYKISGIIKGHNHETPKKEALIKLFPKEKEAILKLTEKETLEKYPKETLSKTPGYCNIGTKKNPIIVTIAGPMYSALPVKGYSQKFTKGLNYLRTYVILKPDYQSTSGWQWNACCI